MNYEEKLLVYLVDGYRKSKKDTGENLTHRRTKVKPEKLYSKYHAMMVILKGYLQSIMLSKNWKKGLC